MAVEIAGDVEKLGLALDGGEVGAAGEIEWQTEVSEVLEQGPDGVDEEGIGCDRAVREGSGAGADVRLEPPQVFVLVGERIAGLAAALADSLGELNHLIDRLLAVQPHDVVEDEAPEVVARSRRAGGGRASTNMGTMTSGHPWRIRKSCRRSRTGRG